jgi:hypothetical protein
VTGDHASITINKDRSGEPKFDDRCRDLCDVRIGVRPRVVDIGNESIE